MSILSLLRQLVAIPTVECRHPLSAQALDDLLSPLFPEMRTLPDGSRILSLRAKDPHAKRVLIDTHMDEIGGMVTELCTEGYLKLTSVGGLDPMVLPSAEVEILGKDARVYGVISSIPPHLIQKEDKDRVFPLSELYVDTGYTEEELRQRVRTGDPVSFFGGVTELQNECVASHALDNKLSCATAIHTLLELQTRGSSAYHIDLLLASGEELGLHRGAKTAAELCAPDLAIAIDTNFAHTHEVERRESVKLGAGPSVSFSAVTHRPFTKAVLALAEEKNIPLQTVAEPNNVGTDGNVLALTGLGVPCVNLSLPLGGMHTTAETASLADCAQLSALLLALLEEKRLGEELCHDDTGSCTH